MAFDVIRSETERMRADLSKLRRFLGVAVTSLLVADLAAIGVVIAADHGGSPAAASASAPSRRQVAVITTPDGRRLLADPTTAKGRAAIQDAIDAGGSVSTFTLPDTNDDGPLPHTLFTIPAIDGVIAIPDGSDLSGLVDTIVSTLPTVPVTVPGGGGGDTTTTSTAGGTSSTTSTTSLLSGPSSTIQGIINDTSSTIQGVVNTTPTTVPSPLGGVVTTVSSLLAPLVPTTTTAPSSTTTTCLVLVVCH
jgi:hypothetical protein